MVSAFFSRKNRKKWADYGAIIFLWLLLVSIFLFSLANFLIYLFVPVDGATVGVRQEPIKVLNTASAEAKGLRQGDIILQIQGHSLDWWLAQQWQTLLDIAKRFDDPAPTTEITLERNGEVQTLAVPLSPRPGGVAGRQFLTHLIVGYAFLAAGLFILKVRGWDPIGRLAVLIMLLLALIEQNDMPPVLGAELGWSMLWLFVPLRLLTRWFAYSYTLVFSLSFPRPKAWLQRVPYLPLAIHLLNPLVTLTVMFSVVGNLHTRHAVAYGWSKNVYIIFLLLSCVILVHTYVTTRDVVSKNQLRWIAWGVVMATVPNILLRDLPIVLFGYGLLPNELGRLLLLFIPVVVAVAILRYRLWDIDLIIKASLVYATLSVALGLIYLALVSISIAFLGWSGLGSGEMSNAVVFFLSALVVAVLFSPGRAYLQRVIDRLFYRNKLNYSDILTEMSRALATSLLINDWLQLLTRTIPQQLNLQGGRIILDALPPPHSPEYQRLKQGRLIWLHNLDGDPKVYPAPLDRLQQARMWSCAPLLSGDELLGLYALGPKKSGEYYSREEVSLLETLARQAGVALKNAQLHQELSAQVLVRRDLEIARQIQLSLLPARNPVISDLDIVGFSMPAEEVGGDFYHYLKFDDRRVGIAVGDVSGKGVSAALFMAVSISTLRAKSPDHLRAPELLAEMNNLLRLRMRMGKMNTALLYTILQKQPAGRWTFNVSNAGLISPLLHRQGQSCQYIDVCGLPLGVMEDVKYRAYHLELLPGDLILLCSDGVVEAMNTRGEMFGFGRLEQLMAGCNGLPAAEIVEQLRQAITTFVGEANQHDDITTVVVRVV